MTEPKKASAIPAILSIAEAISQQRRIIGQLTLAQLPRLAEAVLAADGAMTVNLQCAEDFGSLGRIRGRLEGSVQVTCQRCMQAMPWPLTVDADWTLVGTEADEERLLESREPVLVANGQLLLHEVIEDELLLALPIAPMCEQENCPNKSQAFEPELGDNRRPGDARPNPFAALKGQVKPR